MDGETIKNPILRNVFGLERNRFSPPGDILLRAQFFC